MSSICVDTTSSSFPHHWKCIETEGHKGCTCNGTDKYCAAYECTLEDGSHRFPDGSIVSMEHLEAGGISVATHHLGNVTVYDIPF